MIELSAFGSYPFVYVIYLLLFIAFVYFIYRSIFNDYKREKELFSAVKTSDYNQVYNLLSAGVNPNIQDLNYHYI